MAESHEILLTVPAMPEFLRVVRVTASGLSSRLGFSIDDVDDLRQALDELCFTLIGKGSHDATLNLRYEISDETLAIFGATGIPGTTVTNDGADDSLGELSRQILSALVDDHKVWHDGEGKHFSLLKKRALSAR